MKSPLEQEVSLDELRAGSVQEFEKVYEKYQFRIFFYCNGILRDRQKAEDATAETMIRLWNNLAIINDQQHLEGFLYTTARNVCIDSIRKGRRRKERHIPIDGENFNSSFGKYDPEKEAAEIFDQLCRMALTTPGILTEEQRDVLYLRKNKGLTVKSIAEKMKVSHQTIYNRWDEIKDIMTNLFKKNDLPLLLIFLTGVSIIFKFFWFSV